MFRCLPSKFAGMGVNPIVDDAPNGSGPSLADDGSVFIDGCSSGRFVPISSSSSSLSGPGFQMRLSFVAALQCILSLSLIVSLTRHWCFAVLKAIVNVGRLPFGVFAILLCLIAQLSEHQQNIVDQASGIERFYDIPAYASVGKTVYLNSFGFSTYFP